MKRRASDRMSDRQWLMFALCFIITFGAGVLIIIGLDEIGVELPLIVTLPLGWVMGLAFLGLLARLDK